MTRRRHDPGAPIVVSAYDLCATLYEHVNRFPRAQRTLLGRLILDEALRMLTALTRANRLADKRQCLAEGSAGQFQTPARSSTNPGSSGSPESREGCWSSSTGAPGR